MKSNQPIYKSVLMCLLLASCSPDQGEQKEVAEALPEQYTIEQFLKTESIYGSSFSKDESTILFSSDKSGIYNSYSIGVESNEITQLTNSKDEFARALSYFPNDDRLLFTSDKGGNEINHIFLRQEDGSIRDLTPDSLAKTNFGGWSYDEKSFFFFSNKRDPQFFDLMEMQVPEESGAKEATMFVSSTMYENVEGVNVTAISRDKRYLALTESITTSANHMYLFDRTTGEKKQLNIPDEKNSYSPQYFSADGKSLVYTTDEGHEFAYLKEYNIETGESKEIEKSNWGVRYSYISRTGKYRVVAFNEDAKTKIKIYDETTQKALELPEFPAGDITSVNISKSEKLMSFYLNSSKSPNNLYLYDFETNDYKAMTNTLSPEINANDLVEGEVIRYTSFDGMEIPALLYKPKGIKTGELRPATLMIHGGPGGQSRLNYNAYIQYLVNNGYVVLAVNNRGSSGYGKTFYRADDKKHGDADLKDCVESKKFLAGLGYVDPNKIAITGGSYGGYMVMAALTFAPEEFACGVNIFGVTNWVRTLQSIPPWWASFRQALYEEMGDPATDSVALYNKSPIFFTQNITKPFLVLQGANDPRVLQIESDEIVANAQSNGVEVEYVVFDDEGHGFSKKENRMEAWETILKFLDKNLKEPAVEDKEEEASI